MISLNKSTRTGKFYLWNTNEEDNKVYLDFIEVVNEAIVFKSSKKVFCLLTDVDIIVKQQVIDLLSTETTLNRLTNLESNVDALQVTSREQTQRIYNLEIVNAKKVEFENTVLVVAKNLEIVVTPGESLIFSTALKQLFIDYSDTLDSFRGVTGKKNYFSGCQIRKSLMKKLKGLAYMHMCESTHMNSESQKKLLVSSDMRLYSNYSLDDIKSKMCCLGTKDNDCTVEKAD